MSIIEREVQVLPQVEGPITEREQRARVLEAAALEIEVRGHAKHALMVPSGIGFRYPEGSVCLAGAIGCAVGWDGNANFPNDSLEVFGFYGISEAVQFNNADERTADEVTFLLRWRAEEIRDGR